MRHVIQFEPVSPLPVTLVIAPLRVLMSGMDGFSVVSANMVEALVELSGMVQERVLSEMSQMKQLINDDIRRDKSC